MDQNLFEYLLRLGDNGLVLGHRLSEWCGKAPILEEDIALSNIALDLIGQTRLWLELASEVEDKERTSDDLAFLRDVWDFRNLLLLERPNMDFGVTMMRQFLFDAFHLPLLENLKTSSDHRIKEIAQKSFKEVSYHLERSSDTVIMLGDGTQESHHRMQSALDRLWPYTGEMFVDDPVEIDLKARAIAPLASEIRPVWEATIERVFSEATLNIPDSQFSHKGGKDGRQHSEHLGHMLATMQFLQRSYPGASW